MALLYSKAALLEAFQLIPSNFIGEKLAEHGNYYAAYIAIVEAERAFVSGHRNPYSQLKKRRPPPAASHKDLIRSFKNDPHSYGDWVPEIEQEIEAAHQRRRREDGESEQHARGITQPNHLLSLSQFLFDSLPPLALVLSQTPMSREKMLSMHRQERPKRQKSCATGG